MAHLLVLLLSMVSGLVVAAGKDDAAPLSRQGGQAPLWELGLGAAALSLPHYLGSDQRSDYVLPFPHIRYRGKRLQVDRQGIRSFLFDGERLDLNISFGGSLPVKNEDNRTRQGMDDLDFMVEVGPTLQYTLWEKQQHLLRFDLPVRAAFRLGDQPFYHQGWVSNPRFYYRHSFGPWQLRATAGLMLADRRFHGYFYDVAPAFVTPERPFYRARAGITASRYSLGLKRQIKRIVVGAGIGYYNLNQAENLHSPLIKQRDYLAAAVTVAYIFGESDAPAKQ